MTPRLTDAWITKSVSTTLPNRFAMGLPPPSDLVTAREAGGDEVARGEPGEVVVRGYNVMRGYFENEEATRQAEAVGNSRSIISFPVAAFLCENRGHESG